MKTYFSYYDTVKEFQNFHPTDSNFSFRAGSLFDLGEFFFSFETIRRPISGFIQETEFKLFMRQSAPEE